MANCKLIINIQSNLIENYFTYNDIASIGVITYDNTPFTVIIIFNWIKYYFILMSNGTLKLIK